jgi:hypothetical protein
MQENARLLMEETGCEQGEAELALELAGNDLEKAIRTIGSLLRHIYALKGKFLFTSQNLYGLILLVINAKTRQILRFRTVISYNPALYENTPDMEWYSLEKLIYSYRLDEGSLPDLTQNIEEKLFEHLRAHEEALSKCDAEEMARLMSSFFSPENVEVTFRAEELNLSQFRQMPSGETPANVRAPVREGEQGTVWLNVELVEDKNGKEACKLAEGEMVLSQISDERDIAHYLAHLIGSRRDGKMIPLPAAVRSVSVHDGESEIQVYYAPGIVGIVRVKSDRQVKILETKTPPWWKKILPWN